MAPDGLLVELTVRCEGLTLRSPRDEDIDSLMLVYSDDFDLDPLRRPPNHPDTIRARMVERVRAHRRPTSVDDWYVELVVEAEPGVTLGWATLQPDDFCRQRRVESTSWVAIDARGRGHATVMRKALLTLAFEGLDASVARSRTEPDNEPSRRISEALGYDLVGRWPTRLYGRSEIAYEYWEMPKDRWRQTAQPATVRGHESLRTWLEQA